MIRSSAILCISLLAAVGCQEGERDEATPAQAEREAEEATEDRGGVLEGDTVERNDDEPAQAQRVGGDPQIVLTGESEEHGTYLTDANGRAVYMFTADEKGGSESECYDQCAQAWPPVHTQGDPTAGAPAVKPELLGFITRTDGLRQVTYDGWPLYYYREDLGQGETKGQDVHGHGGEWYLLQPSGEKVGHGEDEG